MRRPSRQLNSAARLLRITTSSPHTPYIAVLKAWLSGRSRLISYARDNVKRRASKLTFQDLQNQDSLFVKEDMSEALEGTVHL